MLEVPKWSEQELRNEERGGKKWGRELLTGNKVFRTASEGKVKSRTQTKFYMEAK